MSVSLELYAITSLNAVKGYLGRPLQDDAENDDWINTQINTMSGMVERYCGRVFTIQSFSNEVHNGNGRSKIRPLYYPVTQLSVETTPTDSQKLASVQYKHAITGVWTDIETDIDNVLINSPKDWELSYQNSHNIELLEETFPSGDRNIRLSYNAGVSGVEIVEVEKIVIEMVVMIWKQSGRGNSQLGNQTISNGAGGQSDNLTLRDLKPEWKVVLDRYKRKQYQ